MAFSFADIWNGIEDGIKSIADAVAADAISAYDAVYSFYSTMLDAILAAQQSGDTVLVEQIRPLYDEAAKKLNEFVDTGGDALQPIYDAIGAAGDTFSGLLTGAPPPQGPAIPGETPGTYPGQDTGGPLQGPAIPGQTPGTYPGQPSAPTPKDTSILGEIEAFIQGIVNQIGIDIADVEESISSGFDTITSLPELAGEWIIDRIVALGDWFDDTILEPVAEGWKRVGSGFLYNVFGVGDPPASGTWITNYPEVLKTGTEEEADLFISQVHSAIDNPKGLFEYAFSLLYRGAIAFTAFAATLEPAINLIRQRSNRAQPIEPIPASDAITAQYQGELTPDRAIEEAAKVGMSAEDYNMLYRTAAFVPSITDAAEWFKRKIIDQEEYLKIAQKNKASGNTADHVLKASFTPPNPATLTQDKGRQAAAATGFLSNYLNTAPPGDVAALYEENQIDPDQAKIDWSLHWNLPPPEWFANAAYRGLRPAADVQHSALAYNYPSDIAGLMLDVSRPLLPARIITSLFAKDIMTEAEARGHFAALGFSAHDIDTLVVYAKSLNPKKPKDQDHDLGKLALAAATELYEDKLITQAQLMEILKAHGYSTDAAGLEIEYIDLKHAAALRKAHALDLVDEVALGIITESHALDDLHAGGYTSSEILRYQKMMKKEKQKKIKLPNTGEIKAMFKIGLIDAVGVSAYFTAEDYSAEWVPLLTALIVNPKGEVPGATP